MKLFIQTFILTVTLTVYGLSARAQTNWVTWSVASGGNGNQFLVVGPSAGLTWNVANQLAQNTYGGYLATITSAAENSFVYGLINNSQYFTAQNGSGPAFGGYNAGTATNPNWSWVTGETFSYTNWRPGDPDYGNFGYGTENSLAFYSGSSSTPSDQWNDIAANDPNLGGFIVERVAPVPEPGTYALFSAAGLSLAFRKMAFRRR